MSKKDSDYIELSKMELAVQDHCEAERLGQQEQDYIYRKIEEVTPDVLTSYSEDEARLLIGETVDVAKSYKIHNMPDLASFCWLRLHSGIKFYEKQPWRGILEEPLIHPFNKAEQILLGFKLAVESKKQ